MYEDVDYYEFLDSAEDSWVDPMEQEHLWDDDWEHDAAVLASAGWGTDEDYGFYPGEIDPPF